MSATFNILKQILRLVALYDSTKITEVFSFDFLCFLCFVEIKHFFSEVMYVQKFMNKYLDIAFLSDSEFLTFQHKGSII